jgi:ABC-type multidrug transport system ATPase subunit
LDGGSIRSNGESVGPEQRRRFGYMPEERGLYPNMVVGEQIQYLGRLHGMGATAATSATTRWLERLDVADRATSKVETLSHGNQQRVQLAAALVHDPEVLVLDEPLAGLDPTGIDVIGQVLVEQARSGRCVLFSSHQLDLVEDLCESVAIIDRGCLVTSGTVDELAASGPRRLAVRVAGDRQGAAIALPVQSLHPARKALTTSEATALFGVILIFVVLTEYLTWTLIGVMEEKASRVVEVLLATVRPIQLLAGKVIGIGVVALAQAMALVAFAFVLADTVGSSLVHGAAPLVVAATLAWLILGYAFYTWVYAAAGSLAERQDQVQSLALPLSAPLILGYIVSLIGVGSGRISLLVRVLAYLPPTAPFAMPTLVGFGQAAWWQFLLSVLEIMVCTVLVAIVASRVYGTAVLKTGGQIRLHDLVPALARRGNRQALT